MAEISARPVRPTDVIGASPTAGLESRSGECYLDGAVVALLAKSEAAAGDDHDGRLWFDVLDEYVTLAFLLYRYRALARYSCGAVWIT